MAKGSKNTELGHGKCGGNELACYFNFSFLLILIMLHSHKHCIPGKDEISAWEIYCTALVQKGFMYLIGRSDMRTLRSGKPLAEELGVLRLMRTVSSLLPAQVMGCPFQRAQRWGPASPLTAPLTWGKDWSTLENRNLRDKVSPSHVQFYVFWTPS